MTGITIAEFDALGDRYSELQEKIDLISLQLKPLEDELGEIKTKITKVLTEQNKTSYVFNKMRVTLKQQASVTTPKTIEEKGAFLDYVGGKYGDVVKWDYISVNSQKLNSFYKAEREEAAYNQNMDFEIPGVGKESIYYKLSVERR